MRPQMSGTRTGSRLRASPRHGPTAPPTRLQHVRRGLDSCAPLLHCASGLQHVWRDVGAAIARDDESASILQGEPSSHRSLRRSCQGALPSL